MGFRDHFRSNKRSDDRTSSISSSSTAGKANTGTTTPNNDLTTNPSPLQTSKTHVDKASDKETPQITLTKTHSRLARTLTWHAFSSADKKEATKDKQLKAWAKEDAVEWTSPMSQRPGRKDMGCQNTLRAFDFRQAALGEKERMGSVGDVSPSCSRVGSVDNGVGLVQQKRLSAAGPGKLSQEIAR